MSDMDVSFRLRLVNDLSKEAKRAEADLKKLDQTVKGLGKGSRGQLDKGLNDLSKKARDSAASIKQLGDGVRNLNGVKTNTVEAEIKAVGNAASKKAAKDINALASKVRDLNALNTNTVEAEIKAVGDAASKKAAKDVNALASKVRDLNALNTNKAEQEVKDIGRATAQPKQQLKGLVETAGKLNSINTNAAESEVKSLGTAAKNAMGDVASLDAKFDSLGGMKRMGDIEQPARRLGGAMTFIQGAAGQAMLALAAFASVDNIIRGLENLSEHFRQLNRDVASVAVTAEMRTPEAVEKIGKSNEKLAVRYGLDQTAVNDARKSYAAAGIGLEGQEAILDPTLKAAKAGDSTGEVISQAVIAVQQNLGVKDKEVPLALDMMAKGSKLGSFEVDAMAKNFPKLATMYAATGRTGLDAAAELIAAAQIVRKGAGSQDQASTNLENLLAKIAAPDAVKNFKEKGVDLAAVKSRADANGQPYMMAVVDEVMRLTKGDQFKIGELFGDMQAKQALAPLINNRELYEQYVRDIRNNSAGTVDADYKFLHDLPKEKADRRGAALEATGTKIGGIYDDVVGPAKERFVRTVNPDYARQEQAYEALQELRETDLNDLRAYIAEREKTLSAIPAARFTDIDPMAMTRQTILEDIAQLKMRLEAAERVQAQDDKGTAPLGKSTGKIPIPERRPLDIRGDVPIPSVRPIEQSLGKDMSGAADQAMDGYNGDLKSALDQAISMTSNAVAQMKALLNFTASPTISPNIVTPTGQQTTKAVPGKQSSLQQSNSTVKLTQHITPQNSKVAAMRAVKEQNRAVRMAQARALSDLGAKTA